MSQPVDKILRGCRNSNGFSFDLKLYCGDKSFYCPSCKSKMQGMIEILEDEAEWLKHNITMNPKKGAERFKEIQSDLNKLKEGLK